MSEVSNTPKKFFVGVYCEANDLYGSVEVLSTDKESAEAMALRVFFRGDGWTVQGSHEVHA